MLIIKVLIIKGRKMNQKVYIASWASKDNMQKERP